MAFSGYLIKAIKTNKIFPNKYIALESFDTQPNVREEIKAVRDDYTRTLTRVTAQGTKSNFKFSTRPLKLVELAEILKFFTDAESDKLQRKIQLEYWNMEDMTYKTSYFYRPDITYKIREISNNDMKIAPIEIQFIEY